MNEISLMVLTTIYLTSSIYFLQVGRIEIYELIEYGINFYVAIGSTLFSFGTEGHIIT